MERKTLLKDLPFGDLKTGDVLTKETKKERLSRGLKYFDSFSEYSIGLWGLDKPEGIEIDKIWNDKKWFKSIK